MRDRDPLGTVCLVLHSHLPWVAGHGRWPVGEEWLYQVWAHSYLPIVRMLERLATEQRQDVVTLGVTPVLAAQLDDPHCLTGFHHWLGNWQVRAQHAAQRWAPRPGGSELAAAEYRAATQALSDFERRWCHGGSPVLRSLVDSATIELLSGPATHPFLPLLPPEIRRFALDVGLTDTRLRIGRHTSGIWSPECGYTPGLEADFLANGVSRFLVDGSALDDISAGHPVGDTDVVCFGTDSEIVSQVWSENGYPAHPDYRDFHTFDHDVGLKPARITGRDIAPEAKQLYFPGKAAATATQHAHRFVDALTRRLTEHRNRTGRAGLVVAAFDTELFGHWWHEGPSWLEQVLRALPDAGIRTSTLGGALEAGHIGSPGTPRPSSWGAGKDWHVWSGPPVADLAETNRRTQQRLLRYFRTHAPSPTRDSARDQVLRESLLALASDWPFMISHDTGTEYARARSELHTDRVRRLLDMLEGDDGAALAFANETRHQDHLFGWLDSRMFAPSPPSTAASTSGSNEADRIDA